MRLFATEKAPKLFLSYSSSKGLKIVKNTINYTYFMANAWNIPLKTRSESCLRIFDCVVKRCHGKYIR